MCGVVGLWNWYQEPKQNTAVIKSMLDVISYRGPDASAIEVRPSQLDRVPWGVGHVRLSIVDVGGGNQPIFNEDQSRMIIGNNEIYNAPELRVSLEERGHRFKTHSDTEVALHAWEEWGDSCFERFNGMFALVLIDLSAGRCVLARDPMGIKPLHFVRRGERVAFASEIKSLLQIPDFETAPDYDSIHLFMNFRYVPNESTLFRDIERVPPGSFVVLDQAAAPEIKRYYQLPISEEGAPPYSQAVETLKRQLGESVDRHLISDVEVASYLSGGIDSSTISFLAARKKQSLRTYCLGFGEPTDENTDARAVAQIIGSQHHDLRISESALERYRDILWHVEEPKVNLMQGYALAEKVSSDVKVVLSGLGGDELFAGYVNNDLLMPMTLFSRVGQRSKSLSLGALQKWFSNPRMDLYFRAGELGLNALNPVSFYTILRNGFDHNPSLLHAIYADPPSRWLNAAADSLRPYFNEKSPDLLNEILRLEARTKLVNDFLLTEDRVSMAHSLEVRVPFLDKNLVDFAFSLPSNYKYGLTAKKRVLKDAISEWLPPSVLSKKKWGFSFNPCLLFDQQLRHFAQTVLTEESVRSFGMFSWKWISEVLNAPTSSRMRWHYFNLWAMAGMTLWHETFFKQHARHYKFK